MAIKALRDSPLFSGQPESLLVSVEDLCARESHQPGVMLFEAGRPAEFLYVLEKGNVALIVRTEAREEVIVSTVSTAGDVFAWSSMVEPRILTASAECLADTTLLRMESRRLESLFAKHPREGWIFMGRLASLIAARLKDTQRRLIASVG